MIWNRKRHDPPHHEHDWVEIAVHIRRSSDGAERVYRTDGILGDDDDTLEAHIWEDGNFACDCNRRDFFLRAGGEAVPDQSDCGDGAFVVWIVNPVCGSVVYDERI